MLAVASLTFALAFVAVGCGDDDDNKPKDQGVEKATETAPPTEAGPETSPGGACLNTADGSKLDTEAKRDDVADKAGACGLSCLGSPDKECAKKCVVKDTGLSDGCSQCYADTIACATDKCLAQCAANPSSQACSDCRSTNCDPAFYQCSGLSSGGDGTPSEAGPETSPDTGAEAGADASAG